MKIVGIAHLYFFTKEEGGQDKLITTNFSTPIFFDDYSEKRFGHWSAVIEFIIPPNADRRAVAEIYLLFHEKDEAPNHLIEPGRKFILVPKVASGEFVSIKNY